MNWLPLRKNNIPLLDRQVDKALSLHQQLRESIKEGDIICVQKLSELQLSIKKRIKEMDQFYNRNCLDQRVRFLQGARLKLSRLLNQNLLIENEVNVQLPWKNSHIMSGSRNSALNFKKSLTPKKVDNVDMPKQIQNYKKSKAQISVSKSPISKNQLQSQSRLGNQSKQKKKLQLIIQDSPRNQILIRQPNYDDYNKNTKANELSAKRAGTNRKMQYIPQKNTKNLGINRSQEADYIKIDDNFNKKQQTKSKQVSSRVSQQPAGQPLQSRNRPVQTAIGKSRTNTENNQTNSMKKLNDLIFTIKMTKEEYEDFMEIKKQLNDAR